MRFLKSWVSQRSGKTYHIYEGDNGELLCNCPACFHGRMCWEVERLTGEREIAAVIKAKTALRTTRRRQWFDEFPELVPWTSLPRVIATWQHFQCLAYRVKCYHD